ncbi:AMP-binding protein [Pelagibacteraceae bacterium]|nr:AMP-binding protein [Pelagibacteraceae bacterium]
MTKEIVWTPPEEIIKDSKLTSFIQYCNLKNYDTLESKALQKPGWLWDNVIKFSDLKFYKNYEQIMDESDGIPWTKWCVGGKTNIVLNCIDRHKDKELFNDIFIFSEKENGETSSITYQDFDKKISQVGNALKSNGFVKGDVIALYMPQIIETYIAYFAILKIGCIVLPLFSGYGSNAVIDRLKIAKAKGIFTSSITFRKGKEIKMFDTIKDGVEALGLIQKIFLVGDEKGKKIFNWNNFENVSDQLKTQEMEAEDPAVIHFTSGTTGKPKGCVYTHIGLVTKMSFDEGILADFKQTDVHFCMADMGWMVGSKSATIASLHGAKMIIAEGVPDFPDEVRFWKLIEKYKVSWTELSPALIRSQMNKNKTLFKELNLNSLRIVCTGGEPWTEKPWRWLFEFIGKSKVPIMNSAGGTEVSGSILHCCLHRPFKVGSFNAPIPGMSADIVNLDAKTVSLDEMGELIMRKSSIGLTKSLWHDDKRYIDNYWSVIKDLWVHGDLASRDKDGHWYLHGRSDDTIKVSGKRIGPAELEGSIIRSGKVKEAAAVGIPDENKGSKIIIAIVALNKNDPEIKEEYFMDLIIKDLGKSFKPDKIIFVSDLPKTRNMKIMRRVIKTCLTNQDPGDISTLLNPESVEEIKTHAI